MQGKESRVYCFVPSASEVVQPGIVDCYEGEEAVVHPLRPVKSQIDGKDARNVWKEDFSGPIRVKKSDVVLLAGVEEWDVLRASPPAVSDLVQLSSVTQPSILFTLKQRYEHGLIYTSIGSILIALNPFKAMPALYNEALIRKYHTQAAVTAAAAGAAENVSSGKQETFTLAAMPHAYAVSQLALEAISSTAIDGGSNQSLVISGESGAGKTETTKHCLQFLAATSGSADGSNSHIRIQKVSPVLEAWGNAKTLRNNNSSRFGKFTEIWFEPNSAGRPGIVGASITTYLLEKSRVVGQEKGERNYHVFYQLLRGLSRMALTDAAAATEVRSLSIQGFVDDPDTCRVINQSGCVSIDGVNDAADYDEAQDALKSIGIDDASASALRRVIAGVMHCGNIDFARIKDDEDDCKISGYRGQETMLSLSRCAELLGVPQASLEISLLKRKVQRGGDRRASISLRAYTKDEACVVRDGMMKEVYRRTFDWIVAKINDLVRTNPSSSSAHKDRRKIGILDIFGFEIFQVNSFEQLCINLCNEVLQQHFNQSIFKKELALYESEGVPVPDLAFNDNSDVIELLIAKRVGCLPLLDEEGIIPGGSTAGYMKKLENQYGARGSQKSAKFHKNPRDRPEIFIVEHYAGKVAYNTTNFMEKNKDTLANDVNSLLGFSSFPFIAALFAPLPGEAEDAAGGGGSKGGKSGAKQTVAKVFTAQLEALGAALDATTQQYVRCIKPNSLKAPDNFDAKLTNEQLLYSGVFEAVIVMRNGYPYRFPHRLFVERYHMLSLRRMFMRAVLKARVAPTAPTDYWGAHRELLTDAAHGSEKCSRYFDLLLSFSAIADDVKPLLHNSRVSDNESKDGIEQSAASPELRGCLVGRSLVFYRPRQHYLLDGYRQKIVETASTLIQRNFRRYFIQKFVRTLITSYLFCRRFLISRSGSGVISTKHSSPRVEFAPEAALLEKNALQLLDSTTRVEACTRSTITKVQDTLRVSAALVKVLQAEAEYGGRVLEDLKGLDFKVGADAWLLVERLTRTQSMLKELERAVNFDVNYFATDFDDDAARSENATVHKVQYHVTYHWTDNAALLQARETIKLNEECMKLYQVFEEGLEEQDELLLIRAIEMLQSRRERFQRESEDKTQGKQESTTGGANDFWDKLFLDQQRRAKAMLLPSQQAFGLFIDKVQEGIGEGAVQILAYGVQSEDPLSGAVADSDESLSVKFSCSPDGLKNLLRGLGYPYKQEDAVNSSGAGSGKLTSAEKANRRVKEVATTLNRLCYLRVRMAQLQSNYTPSEWDDLFHLLSPWLRQLPKEAEDSLGAIESDTGNRRRSYSSLDSGTANVVAKDLPMSPIRRGRRNSRFISNLPIGQVEGAISSKVSSHDEVYIPTALRPIIHEEIRNICRVAVRRSLCPLLAVAVSSSVLPTKLSAQGVIVGVGKVGDSDIALACDSSERAEPFVANLIAALQKSEPYLQFFEESEPLLTGYYVLAQQHCMLRHAVLSHDFKYPSEEKAVKKHTSTAQLRAIIVEHCDLVSKTHADFAAAARVLSLDTVLTELRDVVVGLGGSRQNGRRASGRASVIGNMLPSFGDRESLEGETATGSRPRRQSITKMGAGLDEVSYSEIGNISGAIIMGRVGERQLTSSGTISINALAGCLRNASKLPIEDSSAFWADLLRWGKHLHQLRTLIASDEHVAAGRYIHSTLLSGEQAELAASLDTADIPGNAVQILVKHMIREVAMWAREVDHHDAYASLLGDVANCGSIAGVVGELSVHYPYGPTPSVPLADLLKRYEGKLIVTTPLSTLLINSLTIIFPLRAAIASGDTSWVGGFAHETLVGDIHPAVQFEYQLVVNEVVDHYLQHILSSALSAGQVSLVKRMGTSEENDVDSACVQTDELEAAVHAAEERRNCSTVGAMRCDTLSVACQFLLLSAKVALSIRKCVLADRWEPPGPTGDYEFANSSGGLFCGRLALRGLMSDLQEKSRRQYLYPGLKEAYITSDAQLAFVTIESLGNCSQSDMEFFNDFFLEDACLDPLGDEAMWEPICVARLLGYVSRLGGLNPLVSEELAAVRISSLERRMRVLLFLAAASGPVDGNVNSGFDLSSVQTSLLTHALMYVKRYTPLLAPSETSQLVRVWTVATSALLRTRLVILSSKNCIVHSNSHEDVSSAIMVASNSGLLSDSQERSSEAKSIYLETLQAVVSIPDLIDLVSFLYTKPGRYTGPDEKFDGPSSLLTELRAASQLAVSVSATSFSGFPTQEIVLVIDKLRDIRNEAAVLSAMQSGRPTFHHGDFDIGEVSYKMLSEVLKATGQPSLSGKISSAANDYAKITEDGQETGAYVLSSSESSHLFAIHSRSARMDKLCLFAEVCVNIRRAVLSRLSVEEFIAMNDLSARLSDFDKVSALFSKDRQISLGNNKDDGALGTTVAEEDKDSPIPPNSFLDEISLVRYDLQRRSHINGFRHAFRAGGVLGFPTRLMLSRIDSSKLIAHIKHIETADSQSPHALSSASLGANDRLSVILRAAHEIIEIRASLKRVNERYMRDNTFMQYEDKLTNPLPIDVRILLENSDKAATASSRGVPPPPPQGRRASIEGQLSKLEQQRKDRRRNLDEISRIVYNTTYISDAIASAVSIVGSLAGSGVNGAEVAERYITEEWHEVRTHLSKVTAADKINILLGGSGRRSSQNAYGDVNLLTQESSLRSYLGHAVAMLHGLKTVKNSMITPLNLDPIAQRRNSSRYTDGTDNTLAVNSSGILTVPSALSSGSLHSNRDLVCNYLAEMRHLIHSFVLRQQSLNTSASDRTSTSSRFDYLAQALRPHLQLTAFLQNSLISLVCLWTARETNSYEPLNRDWRDADPSFNYTPRFQTLLKSICDGLGADSLGEHSANSSKFEATSKFTVQGVLRGIFELNGFYHSLVKTEIDEVITDLEDEISYAELSAALAAGDSSRIAKSEAIVGKELDVDLMDPSSIDTTLLHCALERIDTHFPIRRRNYQSSHTNANGDTHTNYLSQLEVASRIIMRMRDHIRCGRNRLAFASLDEFLRPFAAGNEPRSMELALPTDADDRHPRQFGVVLAQIYSKEYYIHPLAAVEFSYLCAFLADREWKELALSSLVHGSLHGSRGDIAVTLGYGESLSWYLIEEVLVHVPIMVVSGRVSKVLVTVLQAVRNLRKDVLAVEESDFSHSDATDFVAVEPADYLSEVMAAAMKGARRHILSNVCTRAPALAHNITARAASIADIIAEIGTGLMTEEECLLSKSRHLESETVLEDANSQISIAVLDSVLAECALAQAHGAFVVRRTRLMSSLESQTIWMMSAGAELSIDSHTELTQALLSVREMEWSVELPAEMIWKKLFNIAKMISQLGAFIVKRSKVDKISSFSALFFRTPEMNFAIRKMKQIVAKIQLYYALVLSDGEGVRVHDDVPWTHRSYLDTSDVTTHVPPSFPRILSEFDTIIQEDERISLFLAIIGHGTSESAAYSVGTSDEGQRLVNADNTIGNAFSFDSLQSRYLLADNFDNRSDRLQSFISADLSFLIAHVDSSASFVRSTVGLALQNLASQVLKIRMAIWSSDYLSALTALKLLPELVSHADTIASETGTHAVSIPDLTSVTLFVHAVQIRRQLQQGITAIALPPVIGWSAYSSSIAPAGAATPHDFVLSLNDAILRDAVLFGLSADNLKSTDMIAELLRIGQGLILIVAAVRKNIWLTDENGAAHEKISTCDLVSSLSMAFLNFDRLLRFVEVGDGDVPPVFDSLSHLVTEGRAASTLGKALQRYVRYLSVCFNAETTYALLQREVVRTFEKVRISGNVGIKDLNIPLDAGEELQQLASMLEGSLLPGLAYFTVWECAAADAAESIAGLASDAKSCIDKGPGCDESDSHGLAFIASVVHGSIGLQQALQSSHLLLQAHHSIHLQREHNDTANADVINQQLGEILGVMAYMQQEQERQQDFEPICNDELTFSEYVESDLTELGRAVRSMLHAPQLPSDELIGADASVIAAATLERIEFSSKLGIRVGTFLYANNLAPTEISDEHPATALLRKYLPPNTTQSELPDLAVFRLRTELLSDYIYLWKQNCFHCQWQRYTSVLYLQSGSSGDPVPELSGMLTTAGFPGDLCPLDVATKVDPLRSVLEELARHDIISSRNAESSISLTLAEINLAIESELANGSPFVSQGELLYFAVKAVYNLRKGRVNHDAGIVRATLALISVHNNVSLGLYTNYYLSLAAPEIELMTEDLVQWDYTQLLENVINNSKGIVFCFSDADSAMFNRLQGMDEDTKAAGAAVDIDESSPEAALTKLRLPAANGMINKLLLYSRKAQSLFKSVLVIYRMRSLASKREWNALLTYLDTLPGSAVEEAIALQDCDTRAFTNVVDSHFDFAEGQSQEFHPKVQVEMLAAKQVACVMRAIQACRVAYSSVGRLSGLVGAVICASPASNAYEECFAALEHARTALSAIPSSWSTRLLEQHRETVSALFHIRNHAAVCDWFAVHSCAALILSRSRSVTADVHSGISPDNGGTGDSYANFSLNVGLKRDAHANGDSGYREPHPLALTEIELAYRHACYEICEQTLSAAISSHYLKGSVGYDLDYTGISVFALKAALDLSSRLSSAFSTENTKLSTADAVQRVSCLEHSAKLLVRLRSAQLGGKWCSTTHGNVNEHSGEKIVVLSHNMLASRRGSIVGAVYNNIVKVTDMYSDVHRMRALETTHAVMTAVAYALRRNSVSAHGDTQADSAPRDDAQEAAAAWLSKHHIYLDPELLSLRKVSDASLESVETVLEEYKACIDRSIDAQNGSASKSVSVEAVGAIEPFRLKHVVLAGDCLEELTLARRELLYREVCCLLLYALLTPGVRGKAGALQLGDVDVQSVQNAIDYAETAGFAVIGQGSARWLLRDAHLLLAVRHARAQGASKANANARQSGPNWAELKQTFEDFDSGNAIYYGSKPRADTLVSLSVYNDVSLPVIYPVYAEVTLVRNDLHFYLCLVNFSLAMQSSYSLTQRYIEHRQGMGLGKSADSFHDDSNSHDGSTTDSDSESSTEFSASFGEVDVDADLQAENAIITEELIGLLASTRSYHERFLLEGDPADETRGSEFERLVYVIELSIELRISRHYDPDSLSTVVTQRIENCHRTDLNIVLQQQRISAVIETASVSYVSLLLPEIQQLGAFFTKERFLLRMRESLQNGQAYLTSSVGLIAPQLLRGSNDDLCAVIIDTYSSVRHNIDKRDLELLKYSQMLLTLRRAVCAANWKHVETILNGDKDGKLPTLSVGEIHFENFVMDKANQRRCEALLRLNVSKEIERCRLEVANMHAVEGIEEALRIGRLIDVYAIARCIHDSAHADVNQIVPETSGWNLSLTAGTYVDARSSERASSESKVANDDSSEYSYRRYLPSDFHKGLKYLSDAVQYVHERVGSVRSHHLSHLLDLAEMLLAIRRAIQGGNWDVAETLIDQDKFSEHMLHESTDESVEEELCVIKAAMGYRLCANEIAAALVGGGVRGTQASAHISDIHFLPLQCALEKASTMRVYVPSENESDLARSRNPAAAIFHISSIVCNVRRAILNDHWSAEDLSENDKNASFGAVPLKAPSSTAAGRTSSSMLNEGVNSDSDREIDRTSADDISISVSDLDATSLTVEILLDQLDDFLRTLSPFIQSDPLGTDHAFLHPERYLNAISAAFELPLKELEGVRKDVSALYAASFCPMSVGFEDALLRSGGFLAALDSLLLDSAKDSAPIQSSEDRSWVWAILRGVHSAFYEMQLTWLLLRERKLRVELLCCLATFDNEYSFGTNVRSDAHANKTQVQRHHSRHEQRVYTPHFGSDPADIYHAEPLRLALSAAYRVESRKEDPIGFSREMREIICTSQIVLRFREAYALFSATSEESSASESSEHLGKLFTEYESSRFRCSEVHGVQELRFYQSSASQVTVARNELHRSLGLGQVCGPLDNLDLEAIEVHNLRHWYHYAGQLVGAFDQTAQQINSGEDVGKDHVGYRSLARASLASLLQQAQLVLALRDAVLASSIKATSLLVGNEGEEQVDASVSGSLEFISTVGLIFATLDQSSNANGTDPFSYSHLAVGALLPAVQVEVDHVRSVLRYLRLCQELRSVLLDEHPVRHIGIGVGVKGDLRFGHSRFDGSGVTKRDLPHCIPNLLPRLQPLKRMLSDVSALLAYDSKLLVGRKERALLAEAEAVNANESADDFTQSRHLLASRSSEALRSAHATILILFNLLSAVVDDNWGADVLVSAPAEVEFRACEDPVLRSFVLYLAQQERSGVLMSVHADIRQMALLLRPQGSESSSIGSGQETQNPSRNIRKSIIGIAFVSNTYDAGAESWEQKSSPESRRKSTSRRVSIGSLSVASAGGNGGSQTDSFFAVGGRPRRTSINDLAKAAAGEANNVTQGQKPRRGSMTGNRARGSVSTSTKAVDRHRRRSLLIVEGTSDLSQAAQKTVLDILLTASLHQYGENLRCWLALARDSFIDRVMRLRLQAVCSNPDYQIKRDTKNDGPLGGGLVVMSGCLDDLQSVLSEVSRILHSYEVVGASTGAVMGQVMAFGRSKEKMDSRGRPRGYDSAMSADNADDADADVYSQRWSWETQQWILITESLLRLRTAFLREGEEDAGDPEAAVQIDLADRIDFVVTEELKSLESRLGMRLAHEIDSEADGDSAMSKVRLELHVFNQFAAEFQAELMLKSCLARLETFFRHHASGAEGVKADVRSHKNDATQEDRREVSAFIYERYETFRRAEHLPSLVSADWGGRGPLVDARNIFQQVEWRLSPYNRPMCMQPKATQYYALLETLGRVIAVELSTAFLNYRSQYKVLAIREKVRKYLFGGAVFNEDDETDADLQLASAQLELSLPSASMTGPSVMTALFGGMAAFSAPNMATDKPVQVEVAATEEHTVLGVLLQRSLAVCDTVLAVMSIVEERLLGTSRVKAADQEDELEDAEARTKRYVLEEAACADFALQMLQNASVLINETSSAESVDDALEVMTVLCDDVIGSAPSDPQHAANVAIIGRLGGWFVVVRVILLLRSRGASTEVASIIRLLGNCSCLRVFVDHVIPFIGDLSSGPNVTLNQSLLEVLRVEQHLYAPTVGRGIDITTLSEVLQILLRDKSMGGHSCAQDVRRYIQQLCETLLPGSLTSMSMAPEMLARLPQVDIHALLEDKTIYEKKQPKSERKLKAAEATGAVLDDRLIPQDGLAVLQQLVLALGRGD